jgi:hypothetical protein
LATSVGQQASPSLPASPPCTNTVTPASSKRASVVDDDSDDDDDDDDDDANGDDDDGGSTTHPKKKRKRAHIEGLSPVDLKNTYLPCYSISDGDRDSDGMHLDVHVAEIESEAEGTQRPNKKNPSADIEEFFEKVPHRKGDKKGRRRCKSCA